MKSRTQQPQQSIMDQLSINTTSYYSRPVAWQHSFYLGEIEESSKYTEWFEIIRTAGENDQINIYINSPGGDYATALQFRRAMMESDATILCSIEGNCHSAASIVFLSADAFSVSEGCSMLLHDYSGVTIGKGSEMLKQLTHEKPSIDNFLAGIYSDFLSPEEIKNVLLGQDMWLTGESILVRAQAMVDARIQEYEKDIEQETQQDQQPQETGSKKKRQKTS